MKTSTGRCICLMSTCLVTFLVLFLVWITDQTPRFGLIGELRKAVFQGQVPLYSTPSAPKEHEITDSDRLLEGLLAAGQDKSECFSRYQSAQYRKPSPHHLSPYLISKLRAYEDLHRRCGPQTSSYNVTFEHLKSGKPGVSPSGCNYAIWVHHSGLGNRMLSIVSSFLYAILTNRVLLIEQTPDMADLFCEPFPNSSWMLPPGFPVRLDNLGQNHGRSYDNLFRKNQVNTSSPNWPPSFLYIHLVYDQSYEETIFFCDEHQPPLTNVPFLIFQSNLYFLPPLFTIPSYQKELSMLFPNKGTVFHHLGRYLFHPSNEVWGLITRFYWAYLANADQTVGIQIRIFDNHGYHPIPYIMDQIESCTIKLKILPELATQEAATSSHNRSLKAVLVASLYPEYYEHMKNEYLAKPTTTMEAVAFHQPSHEGRQQSGNNMHNMRALAEVYLLSISDALVTTGWSTFGYVAYGLGGFRPWILNRPVNRTAPDPPCVRAKSIEPCLHCPPNLSCRVADQNGSHSFNASSFFRVCEENSGIKLFDDSEGSI